MRGIVKEGKSCSLGDNRPDMIAEELGMEYINALHVRNDKMEDLLLATS